MTATDEATGHSTPISTPSAMMLSAPNHFNIRYEPRLTNAWKSISQMSRRLIRSRFISTAEKVSSKMEKIMYGTKKLNIAQYLCSKRPKTMAAGSM